MNLLGLFAAGMAILGLIASIALLYYAAVVWWPAYVVVLVAAIWWSALLVRRSRRSQSHTEVVEIKTDWDDKVYLFRLTYPVQQPRAKVVRIPSKTGLDNPDWLD